MNFDISNLHIEDGSQEARAIEAIMVREHVSAKEAMLRVLREGSMLATEVLPDSEQHSTILAQARERRERKASRRSAEVVRPDTPDALIGCLAEAPEIAEDIRAYAYERRSQSYGR